MANTSATQLAGGLTDILKYGGGTGSVNLYMAHGGTNFGWWAGDLARLLQELLLRDLGERVLHNLANLTCD